MGVGGVDGTGEDSHLSVVGGVDGTGEDSHLSVVGSGVISVVGSGSSYGGRVPPTHSGTLKG